MLFLLVTFGAFLCVLFCAIFFLFVCLCSHVSHLQECVAYEVVTAHAEDEIGALVAAKDAAEERAANLQYLRQYLHVCTSKTSKVSSTCDRIWLLASSCPPHVAC